MRKKGSYHKNRPFRLLVAAALRFVQSYLNDIVLTGCGSKCTGRVFFVYSGAKFSSFTQIFSKGRKAFAGRSLRANTRRSPGLRNRQSKARSKFGAASKVTIYDENCCNSPRETTYMSDI